MADKLNINILPDLGLNARDKALVGAVLGEPAGTGEGFEVTFRRALAAVGAGKGGNKLPQEFVGFTVEDVESIPIHEKKLTGETSVLLGDTNIDTDAVVVFAALQGMQPDAIKALFEKPTPPLFEKIATTDSNNTTTENAPDMRTLPSGSVEETFKQLKELGLIAGQQAAKEQGLIAGQQAAKEQGLIAGQQAAKEQGVIAGRQVKSDDSSSRSSSLLDEGSRSIQKNMDRLPFEAKIRRSAGNLSDESENKKSRTVLQDPGKESYVARSNVPTNSTPLNVNSLQNAQRQQVTPQPRHIGSSESKSEAHIRSDMRDNRLSGGELISAVGLPGTSGRTSRTQIVGPPKDKAVESSKLISGVVDSKVGLEDPSGFRIRSHSGGENRSREGAIGEPRVIRVKDSSLVSQQNLVRNSVVADQSKDLTSEITESRATMKVLGEGNKEQMRAMQNHDAFREAEKIPVAPIPTRDDMVGHSARINIGMDTLKRVNQSIIGSGLEVTNTTDRAGPGDVSNTKESGNNQQTPRGTTVTIEEVPVRVATMVQQRLAGGLPQERWSYHLQLQPRELGNVTVELEMLDGHLEARLIATNIGAKELLGDNLTKLDEAFQNAGLKDNAIHVSIDNRDQSDKKGQRADVEGQSNPKEDDAQEDTAEKQGSDGSYDNGNLDVLV